MNLKSLYTNFLSLDSTGQRLFISKYRERRMYDLEAEPIKKSKAKAKTPTLNIDSETREVLKKLGLTMKEVKLLASLGESNE